jgi:hypothetical protein
MMARVIQASMSGGAWTDYAKKRRNAFFLVYAREFLQAALKTGSPLVRAHLLGHALELMLKTYLLATGYAEKQLRKLGHHLTRILAETKSAGIDKLVRISPEMEKDLREFTTVYASEGLRYFSILFLLSPPRLPELRRLFRFARTLDQHLTSHVRAA